ncbi:MAG TPA: NrfD/PsrC family molybdoenzyme membrane anchor subunit [Candidatus Acidoferrum sp.]|nr:NrfD/PsrC family molybdoenzyme membrane anchor subunit [Candidatus Acidoferrum sp.]
MAEHFVQPPHWEWYIAGYFFCAGLAGGSYTLSTMLRLWGTPRDEGVARLGFLIAFPLVVVCGILLTIDLGQPLRFWHMMINTTPGETGVNFKYWSPISLGTWALLLFSPFAFVSFLEALALDGRIRLPALTRTLSGTAGRVFDVVGSLVALFLASYTGVVLSVSNQPEWSDSWAIGGLFVASALSGSAALLALLGRSRPGAESVEPRLQIAEGYFALIELVMLAVFFLTLAAAGTVGKELSGVWLVLWILVVASLVPPLVSALGGGRRVQLASGGETVVTSSATAGMSTAEAVAVIVGVFLMRIAVVFSAQF